MKTSLSVLLAALSTAWPALAADLSFEKEVEIGAPITSGTLAVFPLRPRGKADLSDYLVLDEAFKAKVLTVHETGDGGSVNTLLVSNAGSKPVYAMAGELLLGGKQDRIIGQSTVIAAGARRAPIPVFCVEHGRWNGRSAAFESGKALGHTTLRKKALFEDQGQVWGEVRASNTRLKTENDSDTYRQAARKLEAETAAGTRAVLKALEAMPDATGMAVAIGGKVTAVEYFGAPALFAKLRQKMVASYVAESLRVGGAGASRPATAQDVLAFMAQVEQAPVKRTKEGAHSQALDYDQGNVAGEKVLDKANAKPVQSSYFSK